MIRENDQPDRFPRMTFGMRLKRHIRSRRYLLLLGVVSLISAARFWMLKSIYDSNAAKVSELPQKHFDAFLKGEWNNVLRGTIVWAILMNIAIIVIPPVLSGRRKSRNPQSFFQSPPR